MKFKSVFALVSFAAIAGTSLQASAAQYPYGPMPYQMPGQMPYQAPYQMPSQMPYQMPYRQPYAPNYGYPNSYQAQQAPAPVPTPTYANPYRGPRPMNNGPFPGNIPGNRMGSAPWSRGPWGGPMGRSGQATPFESNFTPWSRRFWDEIGEGGRNPFRNMDEWVDIHEPREGIANIWDDMINAPHEVGQMPGGWTAPSISVPNPVDVQREFEGVAQDMPEEAKKQMENVEINTW